MRYIANAAAKSYRMLEQKKARIKELRRISCRQVEEFDSMIVAKGNEIAAFFTTFTLPKLSSG